MNNAIRLTWQTAITMLTWLIYVFAIRPAILSAELARSVAFFVWDVFAFPVHFISAMVGKDGSK